MKKLILILMLSWPFIIYSQVYDYEGNKYDTVRIGNQVWLKQNVRSKFYADGTPVTSWAHLYNDSLPLFNPYGYLYSYYAAVRDTTQNPIGKVQGICPNGFHIPTRFEYIKLIAAAGGKYNYGGYTGGNHLKDSILWNGNDSTGFSLLPGGLYTSLKVYKFFGQWAFLWALADEFKFEENGMIYLYYASDIDGGKSCRCVMDNATSIKPPDNRAMLDVYPNPVTDIMYIKVPKPLEKATLFFYNSFGQMVYSCQFKTELDISSFPAGFYFMLVKNMDNKTYFAKFVKE